MLLYHVEFFVGGVWEPFEAIFEMEPAHISRFLAAYKGDTYKGETLTLEQIRLKRYFGERPDITMVYDGVSIAGTHIKHGIITRLAL